MGMCPSAVFAIRRVDGTAKMEAPRGTSVFIESATGEGCLKPTPYGSIDRDDKRAYVTFPSCDGVWISGRGSHPWQPRLSWYLVLTGLEKQRHVMTECLITASPEHLNTHLLFLLSSAFKTHAHLTNILNKTFFYEGFLKDRVFLVPPSLDQRVGFTLVRFSVEVIMTFFNSSNLQ